MNNVVEISNGGHVRQTMGDVAVSTVIEAGTTTTDMTAVVIAIDDHHLRDAVTEEVLIATTVAEEVDHARRSAAVVDTGVLTVDMMMAVPCLDEGLTKSRIYKSSHKFPQKGSSDCSEVPTGSANNHTDPSCSMSSNPSRHVASKPMYSF